MSPPVLPSEFRTPRLVLRAPRPEDASALRAAVLVSLTELRPWMSWARDPGTLAETEERLRQAAERYAAGSDLRLHIWLLGQEPGTQTLIGSCGLHALDWRIPRGEIGYTAPKNTLQTQCIFRTE